MNTIYLVEHHDWLDEYRWTVIAFKHKEKADEFVKLKNEEAIVARNAEYYEVISSGEVALEDLPSADYYTVEEVSFVE